MTKNNQKTSAVLEKKVRVAIAELDDEGVRITNAKVREKTGGSFRDVGPIVKAILAEREARERAESQVPDMPEEVSDLAMALWEAAFRAADASAAADRRARADEIKSLKDELADRDTELGIIEDEKDAACTRADAAERAVAEGAETIVQMKIAAALLEGRIAGLQEALKAEAIEVPAIDGTTTTSLPTEQMLMFPSADDTNADPSASDADTTEEPDPEADQAA